MRLSLSARLVYASALTALLLTAAPEANAQRAPKLAELPPVALTLEQELDRSFGAFVGQVASVLLWDVVFWDNAPALSEQGALKLPRVASALYPDPLGWGFLSQDPGGVSLRGLDGAEQARFEWRGEGPLERVAMSPDGLHIYQSGGARLQRHQRTFDRAEVLELPKGAPTLIETLALKRAANAPPTPTLLFASSEGQLFKDSGAEGFEPLNARLDTAVLALAARSDGAYWAAASSAGEVAVFDSLASDKLVGQVYVDTRAFGPVVRIGLERFEQPSGPPEQRLWVQTAQSVAAWDVGRGEELFSAIALRDLKGAVALPSGLLVLSDDTLRLLPWSGLLPGQVIGGAVARGARALSAREGAAWLTLANGDTRLLNIGARPQEPLGVDLGAPTPPPAVLGAPRAGRSPSRRYAHVSGRLISLDGDQLKVWSAQSVRLPLVVLWLVVGAIFFSVRMRFVNLRLFKHAVDVVRGRYDDPAAAGEVSHFQALTSALSATVGLGNIAGVAIAVSLGGAGATFWMIMAGLLGMASKFTECTLGQKYRRVSADGHVMGGAMHYLSLGLAAERNLPRLGKLLAVLFSFLCVGGSFGGGNAFQVKQSLGALKAIMPALSDMEWVYGLVMMVMTGVVILGGIKSIARTAEKIVPVMCGLYVLACLYIIGVNASLVPGAVGQIIEGAFAPDALYGGLVGVLVVGFQRAAFSNEAGIGSAAIAHAAAKTAYPVREGIVALLEPFIDTVVVCTMTALVIVITNAHQDPSLGAVIAARDGAALTSAAMGGVISFAPYVLAIAVVLFAYSTMISWSYYGERCWAWLFGAEPALFSMGRFSSHIYRGLFLLCVFLGSIINASSILDFSDLMILGMAFPNILGLFLLSKGVRADLDSYEEKLRAGELPLYVPPPPPPPEEPAAEEPAAEESQESSEGG